jgi:hypothetical protein
LTFLDARSPAPVTRALTLAMPMALSLALLAGCAKRESDQPTTPLASVCGSGLRISSELDNALGQPGFYGPAPWYQPSNQNSTGCPYPENEILYASCLTVTAVDTWDETGNGAVGTVYVQDTVSATATTPPYAAMSVFEPTFSPPSLRPLPGDVLDFTGTYEEYPGPSDDIFQRCATLPQLEGASTFRYDGTVPAPVVIQPVDLSTYEGGRKYLNMLVTVENVVISTAGAESSSRYNANVVVPSGSQWGICDQLFDLPGQYPLSANETFTSVTGIVTYFGSYQLAPRSVADFAGGPPVPDAGAPPADAGAPPADAGADGG